MKIRLLLILTALSAPTIHAMEKRGTKRTADQAALEDREEASKRPRVDATPALSSQEKNTMLAQAVEQGDQKKVADALAQGAEVNCFYASQGNAAEFDTPLSLAVSSSADPELTRILLTKQADPLTNLSYQATVTPLSLARRAAAIQSNENALLNYAVLKKHLMSSERKIAAEQQTQLDCDLFNEKEHIKIIDLLFEGANPNYLYHVDEEDDSHRISKLHVATLIGDPLLVKILRIFDADLTQIDPWSYESPIALACMCGEEPKHYNEGVWAYWPSKNNEIHKKEDFDKALDALIEANVFSKTHFSKALFYVAQSNNIHMLKTLIKHGADINYREGGNSPFGVAMVHNNREIAEYLFNQGANIFSDIIDHATSDEDEGDSLLSYLISCGKKDSIANFMKFLRHQASRSSYDAKRVTYYINQTNLDEETYRNHFSNEALEKKTAAELPALEEDAETPLMVAAQKSQADTCVELMQMDGIKMPSHEWIKENTPDEKTKKIFELGFFVDKNGTWHYASLAKLRAREIYGSPFKKAPKIAHLIGAKDFIVGDTFTKIEPSYYRLSQIRKAPKYVHQPVESGEVKEKKEKAEEVAVTDDKKS